VLRPLATGLLEKLGYKVLDAPMLRQRSEAARQCTEVIHLLLTDVVMPGRAAASSPGSSGNPAGNEGPLRVGLYR